MSKAKISTAKPTFTGLLVTGRVFEIDVVQFVQKCHEEQEIVEIVLFDVGLHAPFAFKNKKPVNRCRLQADKFKMVTTYGQQIDRMKQLPELCRLNT